MGGTWAAHGSRLSWSFLPCGESIRKNAGDALEYRSLKLRTKHEIGKPYYQKDTAITRTRTRNCIMLKFTSER